MKVRVIALVCAAAISLLPACELFGKKQQQQQPDEPPPPPPVTSERVPPTLTGVTPLSDFADASLESPDGKTPYEQARIYESRGQLWLARLVLEKKASGPDGTKEENELLAYICHQQEDAACVAECSQRVGRPLKFDGGAPKRSDAPPTHQEPVNDLSRARDLVLKGDHAGAREILEPKLLDGKASKEEIRLLKTVCEHEGDRMCVVLCEKSMK